ncbi:hypothetical protein D3C81_1418160 [compost metagenome]
MLCAAIWLFFTSTKLPMCTSSARTVPGRRRAYGPMMEAAPTTASSIWQKGLMCAPAATVALMKTLLAPTRTPSPSSTLPSNTQPTSMVTSRPQMSSPRTSMRAGSNRVTPRSSSACAILFWWIRSSWASCTLLLTPATSHTAAGWAEVTATPSATAWATISVR